MRRLLQQPSAMEVRRRRFEVGVAGRLERHREPAMVLHLRDRGQVVRDAFADAVVIRLDLVVERRPGASNEMFGAQRGQCDGAWCPSAVAPTRCERERLAGDGDDLEQVAGGRRQGEHAPPQRLVKIRRASDPAESAPRSTCRASS